MYSFEKIGQGESIEHQFGKEYAKFFLHMKEGFRWDEIFTEYSVSFGEAGRGRVDVVGIRKCDGYKVAVEVGRINNKVLYERLKEKFNKVYHFQKLKINDDELWKFKGYRELTKNVMNMSNFYRDMWFKYLEMYRAEQLLLQDAEEKLKLYKQRLDECEEYYLNQQMKNI